MRMLHGSTYEDGDTLSFDFWFDLRDWGIAFWVEKQKDQPGDMTIQIGPFLASVAFGLSRDVY